MTNTYEVWGYDSDNVITANIYGSDLPQALQMAWRIESTVRVEVYQRSKYILPIAVQTKS